MKTTRGLQILWICVSAVFPRWLHILFATCLSNSSIHDVFIQPAASKHRGNFKTVRMCTKLCLFTGLIKFQHNAKTRKFWRVHVSEIRSFWHPGCVCALSSTPKIFNINFGIATWHQMLSCSLCSLACRVQLERSWKAELLVDLWSGRPVGTWRRFQSPQSGWHLEKCLHP